MSWQQTVVDDQWDTPEGVEMMTKIDDEHGERNVQKLTRYGNLWWTDPDRSKGMYVYYCPTHWKQP